MTEVYTDLENKNKIMKKLTGWVFMYNEYTENWQAATRENYNLLYNDGKSENVLKSKSLDTLFDIIRRTGGDSTKIKKLIDG